MAIIDLVHKGAERFASAQIVTVLPCDAAAWVVHPPCHAEGIPLAGGGGTDPRTGFANAPRVQPQPDVIVVPTDGLTPWPSTQPPRWTVVGLFCSPGSTQPSRGTKTIPTTSRTRRPRGHERLRSGRLPVLPAPPRDSEPGPRRSGFELRDRLTHPFVGTRRGPGPILSFEVRASGAGLRDSSDPG